MFNEAGVNRRRKNILERAEASPRDHAEIKTKGGGQVPAHIHQSTSITHHLQRILSSHCRVDTKALGTNCGNNVHVKRMRVKKKKKSESLHLERAKQERDWEGAKS